jgi:hypothetical protein
MKKLLSVCLVFLLVFLSSCSFNNDYDYENNRVQNIAGINSIVTDMMDNWDHTIDTEVQYDLVSIALGYHGGVYYVDTIVYNIYSGNQNNGVYEFDNYQCRSKTEGNLTCTESEISKDVTELKETINLGEIKELLSKVDENDLVNALRTDYGVTQFQNVIIAIEFEHYTNHSMQLGESEDLTVVYLKDDLNSTGSIQLNDVVMLVKVVFAGESGASVFHVYVD